MPATKQDVPHILNIVKQAFVQYCSAIGITTIAALCETEQDILDDMRQKEIYIAYCDGVPVGSIRLKVNEDSAFISRFSILPEYQSLGIGSEILSFVDGLLTAYGVKQVELYSAIENQRLQEFYTRNGFKVISIDSSRGYQRGLLQKEF